MSKRGDDDARAFAEAMRGAKPLAAHAPGRVPLEPTPMGGAPARRTRGARARAEAYEAPPESLAESARFAILTVGDAIEARAAGVDIKLLRRLKAGEPRASARLDLHGRSRQEALDALERLVERARGEGARCVLVIHGRGAHSAADGPVLKPLVWRWLATSPTAAAAVLAFASAHAAEGGDGATRVLLRKPGR